MIHVTRESVQTTTATRSIPRWLLPALVAAATSASRLSVGPLTIDDAYITFRYARNIAEGVGFVYNPGERVLGTTTPLWTLLLAACYMLGGRDLPQAALVLGSLADAATVTLLWWLCQHLGMRHGWAIFASILYMLWAPVISFTNGGMETPLFILLVVSAVTAHAADRHSLAGLAAGLATITRPEGLLAGVLVLGNHVLRNGSFPRRSIVGFIAPVTPWILFALWYFGSPWPQSAAAKASTYVVDPIKNLGYLLGQLGIGALLLPALTIVYVWPIIRWTLRHPEWRPFVVFAPGLFAAYMFATAIGVGLFPWYGTPLVPFFLVGVVAIGQRATRGKHIFFALTLGIAFLLLPAFGLTLWRDPEIHPLAPKGIRVAIGREPVFQTAAEMLAPCIGPETVVAMPEIGAFGYTTEARILDTVGLVSPEALAYYPIPFPILLDNAVPPALIRDKQPDFVVGLDVLLPPELLESDWFRMEYRHLRTLPTTASFVPSHPSQLLIYARSDYLAAHCDHQ